MRNKFSSRWMAGKKPRKQVKYRANAPLHTKHKFLSSHLSKELRAKYGKRAFPLRKGDEVIVMRGSFKKKKAKISSVKLKLSLVSLENIQRTKKDGTKVNVWFHPSSLQIQSLFSDDKERIAALNRKKPKSEGEKNASEKSNIK